MAFGKKKNVENLYTIDPKKLLLYVLIVVVIVFLFQNLNIIRDDILKVLNILTPVFIGAFLTYVMAPVYNTVKKFIIAKSKKNSSAVVYKRLNIFSNQVATIVCVLFTICVGVGLIFLFVPQLYSSITSFAVRAEKYLADAQNAFKYMRNTSTDKLIIELFKSIESFANESINSISNFNIVDFTKLFANVYNGVYVSFKALLNILIGLVVMIYTLNIKDELKFGLKRIIYALFNKEASIKIIAELRFAHKTISGFFLGKLLDSLIIGAICYVCCIIMRMPYSPLIALIVGFTNIIPFFGPFIGAIPSFVIILLEETFTWKPWGFLILILAIQQLDGNVIGPKILGNKTGVSSFEVLFSILLFGGLFGFVGMIIAVPLWAIMAKLFNEYIVLKLYNKNIKLTQSEQKKLEEYNKSIKE